MLDFYCSRSYNIMAFVGKDNLSPFYFYIILNKIKTHFLNNKVFARMSRKTL